MQSYTSSEIRPVTALMMVNNGCLFIYPNEGSSDRYCDILDQMVRDRRVSRDGAQAAFNEGRDNFFQTVLPQIIRDPVQYAD